MKCINKKKLLQRAGILGLTILCASAAGCGKKSFQVTEYEKMQYNKSIFTGDTFSTDLCVTNTNIPLDGYAANGDLHAVGLFDVGNKQVLYSDRIFERLFPASTTKAMTAYVALKYANMEDIVTVSQGATEFEPEATLCGLQPGDQVSMQELLTGLVLASGNDCGSAIAEHISGSVEAFAELMNQEAAALGATQSHFVNPHGLHDENHYTTAYDLYLIFNACLKDQRFIDIITLPSYTATITGATGETRNEAWQPTNYYSLGEVAAPSGINVFGGKTGTTDEAGSCLILYDTNTSGNPYISIVMGAPDKTILYTEMTSLLTTGIAN